MNAKLCGYIVDCLNPTVNRQVGDIRRIPIAIPTKSQDSGISILVKTNVEIKKRLCQFSIVESLYLYSPFIFFTQGEFKFRLSGFYNLENHLITQILLNEAIINEKIFEVYDLTEHDKAMVLAKEGVSIGGLPITLEARAAYLSETEATKEFLLTLFVSLSKHYLSKSLVPKSVKPLKVDLEAFTRATTIWRSSVSDIRSTRLTFGIGSNKAK